MMTSPTSQQRYGPTEEGLLERLRGAAGAFTGYSRARLELFGIEGREAAGLYLKLLIWGLAGVVLAFTGYLLLCVGIVAVIARTTGVNWGWGVLLLALVHIALAAVCLFILRRKSRTPVFTATIQEFHKDEQWLKTQK